MGYGIILSPAAFLKARFKADRFQLGLALLGFSPFLITFLVSLWSHPTYQFFPLALFGASLLFWRAVKESEIVVLPGANWLARCLGLGAAGLTVAAFYFWSPWLSAIAFLAGLASMIYFIGGWPLLRSLAPTLLMLLAIVPPPFAWDEKLTLWLRSLAMMICSALLDCLQVNFVRDGNALQLPGKMLLVEEACSGINSFVLGNVVCLFWFLWQRRPWRWLFPALLLTSLFVILGNIIRITSGTAMYYFWHRDLLSGWKHETFGLVLLLTYCGLILSLDQLFVFLWCPVRIGLLRNPPPAANIPVPIAGPAYLAIPSRSVFGLRFVGTGIACMGIATSVLHLHQMHLDSKDALAIIVGKFKSVQEFKFSVPEKFGSWTRLDSASGNKALVETLGVHSVAWHFQSSGLDAILAVDYPLDGFHNVRLCYEGNGWKLVSEVGLLNSLDQQSLHAIRLDLQQSLRHAVVLHTMVDGHGEVLTMSGKLLNRIAPAAPPVGYRIQLVAQGYAPLSGVDLSNLTELFLQARQLLVPQIVAQVQSIKVP